MRPWPAALLPALLGCQPGPDAPIVIVVVLDGVRPEESFGDEALSQITGLPPSETMPRIWSRLVPRGARALQAYNVGATITAPAHCAMLSGRRQALGNYGVPDAGPGTYRPELPSVLEELRASGVARRRVSVIGNTDLIQPLGHSLWPTPELPEGATFTLVEDAAGLPSQDDRDVGEQILHALVADGASLVVANLHDADRTGHYGEPESMPEDLARTDEAVADLWSRIRREPELRSRTWLVVTADHGRHHESALEPAWRHHGDACRGCRHVPLMVLGPDVREGETTSGIVLLEDVSATVAGLLGVDLPWSEGVPVSELFAGRDLGDGPSGVAEAVSAGGHRLEVERTGDPSRRTRVALDGRAISSADALLAEAPALTAHEGQLWACWRELVLDPEAPSTPWVARCVHSVDGGLILEPVAWPEAQVGPFWSVALAAGDGVLYAAWPHNPNGITAPGIDGEEVTVRAGRFDGAWAVVEAPDSTVTFPTDPSIALLDGGEARVAFGAGVGAGSGERRIGLARAVFDGEGASLQVSLQDLAPARLERPALHPGAQRVAFVATEPYRSRLLVAGATRSGWEVEGELLPSVGAVAPNVTPVWVGDEVAFATWDGAVGLAYLCRGAPGAESACVEAGGRVAAIGADEQSVWAIVDAGVGDWVLDLEAWR